MTGPAPVFRSERLRELILGGWEVAGPNWVGRLPPSYADPDVLADLVGLCVTDRVAETATGGRRSTLRIRPRFAWELHALSTLTADELIASWEDTPTGGFQTLHRLDVDCGQPMTNEPYVFGAVWRYCRALAELALDPAVACSATAALGFAMYVACDDHKAASPAVAARLAGVDHRAAIRLLLEFDCSTPHTPDDIVDVLTAALTRSDG